MLVAPPLVTYRTTHVMQILYVQIGKLFRKIIMCNTRLYVSGSRSESFCNVFFFTFYLLDLSFFSLLASIIIVKIDYHCIASSLPFTHFGQKIGGNVIAMCCYTSYAIYS